MIAIAVAVAGISPSAPPRRWPRDRAGRS